VDSEWESSSASGEDSLLGMMNNEHYKSSQQDDPKLNFYLIYPSKDGKRSGRRGKLGYFENLRQLVAAGFDPTTDLAKCMDKDYKDGGLLMLSCDDKDRIESSLKSLLKKELTKIEKYQEYCLPFRAWV
jgi:hypothetical protein